MWEIAQNTPRVLLAMTLRLPAGMTNTSSAPTTAASAVAAASAAAAVAPNFGFT